VAIGTDVQAYDADLTTWAGITPSANVQSLCAAADYAAMLALLTGQAGASFSWNSQALTSVGAIGCASVTATGALADGSASTLQLVLLLVL